LCIGAVLNKSIYIESLLSLGGKKNKDSIEFISNGLMIRDKASRVEYTVVRVYPDERGKPIVLCYRYYLPDSGEKKVYIRIPSTDFTKYEPV
jgi:hypothetical protein